MTRQFHESAAQAHGPTSPSRDDDTFVLSLQGACYVAALEYEAAFGAVDGPAEQVAATMFSRIGPPAASRDEATYDCDCCGKPTPLDQISRGIAYGIETFACEECWS
jgi:hypothetical protein